MERVTGPYKGFYIAAYSVEADDLFVGYAKVCVGEPESVWNANSVQKLTSASGCHTEIEAVLAAERKARQAIAEILGNWDPITAPGELN
jgi:hypothetical protein